VNLLLFIKHNLGREVVLFLNCSRLSFRGTDWAKITDCTRYSFPVRDWCRLIVSLVLIGLLSPILSINVDWLNQILGAL